MDGTPCETLDDMATWLGHRIEHWEASVPTSATHYDAAVLDLARAALAEWRAHAR